MSATDSESKTELARSCGSAAVPGSTSSASGKCQHCGKEIERDKSWKNARSYRRKFCDSKCFGESLKVERVEKPCPVCGKLKWYRPIEEAKACKGACVSELCKRAWKDGKFANQSGPTTEAGMQAVLDAGRKWREKAQKTGELEELRIKSKIARGLEDHVGAKKWEILDPSNKRYKAANLQEWCRQNTHRFHDKNPSAKMPFWERVSAGLMKTLGDNESVYYQGWRAISKSNVLTEGPAA
jgi:hypothetical protein